MNPQIINIAYIVSAVIFILGIKMLGKAETARKGNILSSVGMLVAVVFTLFDHKILDATDKITWAILAGGLLLGTLAGWIAAKKVKMTSMPEMVALLNGFGGLASLLVAWAEYHYDGVANIAVGGFSKFAIISTILIGGVTFTGSAYAWAKLSGKLSGKPAIYAGQKAVNAAIALLALASSAAFTVVGDYRVGYEMMAAAIVLSLVLGIVAVMPIGGGDMPVVISLIQNNVLIVAGSLVGASGVILTVIMCKSMNRTLSNVLFSGFGSAAGGSKNKVEGEMKAISADDAYYILEAAQSVVFIPGYGMAVAQAQHAVKELAEILENNGSEVAFAIHPVAGRMPGHMNVLLAEADVPYEQLKEMEEANKILENADVAIVIGANDVVNPAAAEDKGSPIYGMPIIEAFKAKTVLALKRGKGAGFSGLENGLFFRPNTRMIYGDAKATINELVSKFKDA